MFFAEFEASKVMLDEALSLCLRIVNCIFVKSEITDSVPGAGL